MSSIAIHPDGLVAKINARPTTATKIQRITRARASR
jgi:hypothetical protein